MVLTMNPQTRRSDPDANFKKTFCPQLWQLRVALDRRLTDEEWSAYLPCKHRGFHWISRAEEKAADGDSKGEGGAVKKGLAGTKKLMLEKSYRTAAEMVIHEFPDAQRNKRGDYGKALSRELLDEEAKELFQRQRGFGNPHAGAELEIAILGNGDKKSGLFWEQKPSLTGEQLLDRLGRCTFERPGGPDGKGEYRAPKASFTAERHVWLTRLNNLRIVVDGKIRPLTETERHIALPLPYQQAGDFKYKQLRNALTKAGLSDDFRFAGLSYPSERQKNEEKAKDPEDERLVKLPAWQELRKTLKDAGLENEWQQISVAALDDKPELLDKIAEVLSVYKEDAEVETELRKLPCQVRTDGGCPARHPLRQIQPRSRRWARSFSHGNSLRRSLRTGGLPPQPVAQGRRGRIQILAPVHRRDSQGRLKFNEDMDTATRWCYASTRQGGNKVTRSAYRNGARLVAPTRRA